MTVTKHRGFTVEIAIESAPLIVLACAGELDMATEANLDDAVERGFARSSRSVHIACSEVTFMDSMGIRALMRAARRLSEGGRPVSFAFNPRTLRILARAGLDEQLRPLPA
jgi:anti-anti-sigma factor